MLKVIAVIGILFQLSFPVWAGEKVGIQVEENGRDSFLAFRNLESTELNEFEIYEDLISLFKTELTSGSYKCFQEDRKDRFGETIKKKVCKIQLQPAFYTFIAEEVFQLNEAGSEHLTQVFQKAPASKTVLALPVVDVQCRQGTGSSSATSGVRCNQVVQPGLVLTHPDYPRLFCLNPDAEKSPFIYRTELSGCYIYPGNLEKKELDEKQVAQIPHVSPSGVEKFGELRPGEKGHLLMRLEGSVEASSRVSEYSFRSVAKAREIIAERKREQGQENYKLPYAFFPRVEGVTLTDVDGKFQPHNIDCQVSDGGEALDTFFVVECQNNDSKTWKFSTDGTFGKGKRSMNLDIQYDLTGGDIE